MLRLTLLLGVWLGFHSTAMAAGSVVLREKFNDALPGTTPGGPWQVVGSVTVEDVPFPRDRSVLIQKVSASGESRLSVPLASLAGRVVFDARVMARETAGFRALPYIYDSGGVVVAAIAFQDGEIRAWVGGVQETVQPFRAHAWYQVRVVVDTDTDRFDLYVDGVRKLYDRPLRNAARSLGRLSFFIDGANTGTMFVNSVTVYREQDFIGAPRAPVFDVRTFGAVGDGRARDTAALQRAIDAVAGTGGSVVLSGGTFLSGTLTLRSEMTFFIDATATLLGTTAPGDYPAQRPNTGNTQLSNCQRALLYAPDTTRLTIDGGGTIDGQGDAFGGSEATRPMLVWAVGSNHFTVQNLYLKKGAMWSLVSMESDQVLLRNLNLQSDNITHDGIDLVDGHDITVENVAVRSGDDAMCLKSGVRRGLDTVVIRDSMFSGSNGGSNGIKFGTASYGAFRDVTLEDNVVKDVQYAAMALESRQGADVSNITFRRISFGDVGVPFFVYLAQQLTTRPLGDVPKLGTMTGVAFSDITGWTKSWANSPHQGALITGHAFGGVLHRITGLSFENVAVVFTGGRMSVPSGPPEAQANQYPESNMFGDLPAWGYYLRHVDGVSFLNCTSSVASGDARRRMALDDVRNLVGRPTPRALPVLNRAPQ